MERNGVWSQKKCVSKQNVCEQQRWLRQRRRQQRRCNRTTKCAGYKIQIHQTQTDDHGKTTMIIGYYSDCSTLFHAKLLFCLQPAVCSLAEIQLNDSILPLVFVLHINAKTKMRWIHLWRTFVNYYEILFSILLYRECTPVFNINVYVDFVH